MSNPNVAEVLKRLDNAREVVRALGRGEKLQYKEPQAEKWKDSSIEKPTVLVHNIMDFNFSYRVKPEPLVMHAIVDKDGYVYPQTNEVSAQNAVLTWNHQSPGKGYRLVRMVEEIQS